LNRIFLKEEKLIDKFQKGFKDGELLNHSDTSSSEDNSDKNEEAVSIRHE